MNTPPTFDATAIILAGGGSRRMGTNKCLLPYHGVPLIQHVVSLLRPHFRDLLISANDPAPYAFLNVPTVSDALPDQGPLMGIASCLAQSRTPWNFVIAADMPVIPEALLRQLFGARAGHLVVVPQLPSGKLQPLFGFYHQDSGAKIGDFLKTGSRRVHDCLATLNRHTVPIPKNTLPNLNTPDEYDAATKGDA